MNYGFSSLGAVDVLWSLSFMLINLVTGAVFRWMITLILFFSMGGHHILNFPSSCPMEAKGVLKEVKLRWISKITRSRTAQFAFNIFVHHIVGQTVHLWLSWGTEHAWYLLLLWCKIGYTGMCLTREMNPGQNLQATMDWSVLSVEVIHIIFLSNIWT